MNILFACVIKVGTLGCVFIDNDTLEWCQHTWLCVHWQWHTRVVSTKCTPGFTCRAFSDTTLVCFIVNEHTTKCSHYIPFYSNYVNLKDVHVGTTCRYQTTWNHDDVIKWKQSPRYWSFVRGIHRSLVNSPHKGQWRGALMPSLIWAWINAWVNNRGAGDLRRHCAHYDVFGMTKYYKIQALCIIIGEFCVLIQSLDTFFQGCAVAYRLFRTQTILCKIIDCILCARVVIKTRMVLRCGMDRVVMHLPLPIGTHARKVSW